jgi:hypothetical protein
MRSGSSFSWILVMGIETERVGLGSGLGSDDVGVVVGEWLTGGDGEWVFKNERRDSVQVGSSSRTMEEIVSGTETESESGSGDMVGGVMVLCFCRW